MPIIADPLTLLCALATLGVLHGWLDRRPARPSSQA